MEHTSAAENGQSRLQELGQEWGIDAYLPPDPLMRPETPPSYQTESDDSLAEELLRRQRMSDSQSSHGKGLSRAFTTKKKNWEYKEIYNALSTHVTNRGAPGVAQALIAKLNLVGGNVNLAQKSRTSLLTRRKSLDLAERSQVLQRAVENGQREMVEVLLPFADALSLDTALPVALRNQDTSLAMLLVSYGASVASTEDCQEAFRRICAQGGNADLVSMVLVSDGRSSQECVSQCMVDAARAGCLSTVVALSQSTADGNHDGAAALKAAIGLGRRDIALAILLGDKPPDQQGLSDAFEQLMHHQNINANEKTMLAEALLCAGAGGDSVARALIHASATDYLDMVHLLVYYGASIEYENAVALRRAISKSKMDLAEILLNGSSPLNSIQASECVEAMPKKMRFEDRQMLLKLLLRKGASGEALDEALVDAAEAGDVESAKLLVTPQFPGKVVGDRDLKRGPRSMIFERHEVASAEHKGALALQLAVKQCNVPIMKLILANRPPTNDAMAQIFPSVRNLPRLERFQMTEAFLAAGLSGPSVHSALQNVVDELPPHRDDRLVALLLRSNADVNFNEGAAITAAISQKDMSLFTRLMKSNPTPKTAAKALPKAIMVNKPEKRLHMVSMLIAAGAGQDGSRVFAAVDKLLQTKPVDKDLLKILLQQGNVDMNTNNGMGVIYAMQDPDPETLEIVLDLGNPNAKTVEQAMQHLSSFSSDAVKAEKLGALIRKAQSPEVISKLLVDEVQNTLKTPLEKRTMSVARTLLANGADINAYNGEALCRAVASADTPMVDLLFRACPNPHTLSFAMPHALRIKDLMDRLTFAQRILEGGIPPVEVNRALVFAVNTYPDDIPLINALLSYADTKDGLALIEAIKGESQDVVELMLGKKKFTPEVLNHGFAQATRGKNRRQRSISCNSLLKAGASGEVVSDALLAAATDGDLELGTIIVQNGGSIEHKDGQAVVEACRSGAAGVLSMLLSGNGDIAQPVLRKGFQAATEISDLERRAEIFKLLLQQGVTGEVVDAELISAERFGDTGTDLLKLLLAYGASPDYKNGEAVAMATKSAFLANLEMLLGIIEVGGRQKKPSSATLVRAIDSCWNLSRDTRYTVMTWIFQAGKPAPSTLHSALSRVVNEEDPEERLIQLLITNRANPAANGCQTLIDATHTLPPTMFAHLLESKVSRDDASVVFRQAFAIENVESWLSDTGLGMARLLLGKGAFGDGVSSAFAAILNKYAEDPGNLTQSFMELLLAHDADINSNQGEALQIAASQGKPDLVRRLLQQNPNAESLTLAFRRIFDAEASEDEICELIQLLTEHGDSENRVDVMFTYPDSEPVMVRALSRFPRSTAILQALLDAGYYHDQMISHRVSNEVEKHEQVTLLEWALLQPQKKISSAVITMLINRGAKVNFETRITRITPLMLAIDARRQDIVKSLLLAGAEVDITDATGRSPLSTASAIGGDLAITMMSNLLAAGASRNDGSLHNAARELNLQAMQILMEYRHEPDFPSPQHGGRSALGELCLHAADSGEITAIKEKAMERAINFLLQDSDITIQTDGKSVLLLALESVDPLTTAKVLLRADMWKYINKPFNQYTDGAFTYSPTQYVLRVMPQSDVTPQLANRGTDVYYANSGPQPEGAIGMPESVLSAEQERKARLERAARESEDHAAVIARQKELAAVQAQIWAAQAELEDVRKKRAHHEDLSAIQERAHVEEQLFAKAMAQQRARQTEEVMHQKALTDANVRRTRDVGNAELALENQRQSRMLEWEREVGNERVGNATQLSSIRLREREEMDRFDKSADGRFRDRIREQKKLVDSQSHLAANLGNQGQAGRRQQIGYVSGELD
ncbi:2-5A-dependent ribonuclease [Apiospora phragmitis]|uniref:2-5A-dependent ribonuclease n=1 Tax=Apiospora phragmitis TaxID=2905665 RepID=A0ABR1T7E1_9PEZI